MRYRDDRNPPRGRRRFKWRGPRLRLEEAPEPEQTNYSGPIYNDGMLDEVDVVAPKYEGRGYNPLMREVRSRIARNVTPASYGSAISRLTDAILFDETQNNFTQREERNALFDLMMGQPVRPMAVGALYTSPYRPTNSQDEDVVYLSSPVTEAEIRDRMRTNFSLRPISEFNEEEFLAKYPEQRDPETGRMMNLRGDGTLFQAGGEKYLGPAHVGQGYDQTNIKGSTLANFTISQGEDERGKYISYYDIWDLAPFQKYNFNTNLNDAIQSAAGVKPQEIYGRLYYTENEDGTLNFIDDPVPVLQETQEYEDRKFEGAVGDGDYWDFIRKKMKEQSQKNEVKKYRNGGIVGETVGNRIKKYREGGPVGEPAGERIMLDEVDVVAPKFQPKGLFKGVRKRIAENINPFSYRNAPSRVMKALLGLKEPDYNKGSSLTERHALLDIAMGQPVRDTSIGALTVSQYQPSQSSDSSAVYFRSPVTEDEIKDKYKHIDDIRSKDLEYSTTLGNYTIGTGEDEKGKYISYYDLWDLDPFQHSPKLKEYEDEAEQLQSAIGVTSPEVYGRLYYKKNPDGSITYLD